MAVLPSGVVTFLFTDVVGSTPLWESEPTAMGAAMTRHDELVETAVQTAGGMLVRPRGEGDSRFAVFTSPTAALTGAVGINLALQVEVWAAAVPIRVRTAVGTGEADLRAGDYYGDVVNRVARLRAAGHPGQVLVADTTAQLALGALPAGVGLVDCGVHRLKDLSRPERIYQLTHPGLAGEFPPLLSLDRARHNLPIQLSSFVGREQDVTAVRDLLAANRLVTITGFGGMGKTRLALQVGAELADGDGDGVWFIDLSAATDPNRVPPAIAETLGISETGDGPAPAVQGWLADKRLLLILDNLEQITGCAPFVAELLAAAPEVRILATSRAPLHVRGERDYELPPLPLADPTRTGSADALAPFGAVRLFVDRAVEARHDFTVTNTNVQAVAAICARLDGHPLSIELAAARVKILTPQALLARLDSALSVLTSTGGDRPDRQQTLRATIAWSYDALPAHERLLLDCLSVFPGTATLDAIEAICGPAVAASGLDVLDGLSSLADNSLLRIHPPTDPDPDTRYSLLVPIRDYATEHLNAPGGEHATEIRRRHAEHYYQLAVRLGPALEGDANVATSKAILTHDVANLRAALAWAQNSDPGMMLDLVGVLRIFFWLAGSLTEGLTWVVAAIESASPAQVAPMDPRRGNAWDAGAWLATHGQDVNRAIEFADDCATLRRALGDERGLGRALELKARASLMAGDFRIARSLFNEAAEFARRADDAYTLTAISMNMGDLCLQEHDFEGAYTFSAEALQLGQARADTVGSAIAALNVAQAAIELHRPDEARSTLLQGLELTREIGYTQLSGSYLIAIAAIELDRDARYATFLLGVSAATVEETEEAVQGYEAGLRDRTIAAARSQLSAAEFDAALQDAQAADIDDVLNVLLDPQQATVSTPRR